MELNYSIFKAKSELEKNSYLLLIAENLESADQKELKRFLINLFTDPTQDFYLRKRALDLFSHLVFTLKANPEGLVDLLLDVDDHENEFVIISSLRIGSYLINVSQESILQWANRFTLNMNHEIRSEAFLLLGKDRLFEGLCTNDSEIFIRLLREANGYFLKSSNCIENRIDAIFFNEVTQFLLTIRTNPYTNVSENYLKIQSIVWEYLRMSIIRTAVIHFVNIIQPISVINYIAKTDPQNWLDFRMEFNQLLIELTKLDVSIASSGERFKDQIANSFSNTLQNNIIFDILGYKFQNELAKLKRIRDESYTVSDKIIIQKLIEATGLISGKKKDLLDKTGIIASLSQLFPDIQTSLIGKDVDLLDFSDPASVLRLVQKYDKEHSSRFSKQTLAGTPQGDEILKIIADELEQQLPKYATSKRQEFFLVLRDVIKYFIRSTMANEQSMPFLFKSNAIEKDLHNDMIHYFQMSERSHMYTSEVSEIADGGRVDILYRGHSLEIPIELKKSTDILSWASIEANYISQAQTYSYTRDQLAIFIVLDTSPKDLQKPSPNIRDLFKVLHIEPKHNLEIKYPDYVISFVVTGNKPKPSERSKYS